MTDRSTPAIATATQSSADTVVGVQGGLMKRFPASPAYAQLAATTGAGLLGFDDGEVYDAGTLGAEVKLKADADDAALTGTTTAEEIEADSLAGGYVRCADFDASGVIFNFAASPSTYANQWLYSRLYGFGTVAAGSTFSTFNSIIAIDQANAQAVDFLSGAAFVYRAAVGAVGSRVALHSDMGITGAVTTGTSDGNFVSCLSAGFASAGAGGTGVFTTDPGSGYIGQMFGGNDHPRLAAGANYWYALIGREINAEIETGATAYARVGLFVVTGENAASQAFGDDVAIAVSNKAGTSLPWKHGIKFGMSWGVWPFNSSSTLIGAKKREYPTSSPETTIEADFGIDFSEITFTTAAFKSPGFLVDPDGDITGKSLTLTATSTPASASAAGTAGQFAWDSSYIYIATAANTWKRAALSTW